LTLSDNPVAHPAIGETTNQISGAKVVWETKLNPTGFIQRFQLIGRKREISGEEKRPCGAEKD
jgi:hypothetical protein